MWIGSFGTIDQNPAKGNPTIQWLDFYFANVDDCFNCFSFVFWMTVDLFCCLMMWMTVNLTTYEFGMTVNN